MIKNSETKIIKRSQINLNPINPKRHTDRAVKLQEKNLKKVGFLGGIVWNRNTGNLIDGHRRIMAMDLYYKYDGANDYDVKVESVELDDKTEKEQLTYMAVGNTKPDIDLIAKYIGDIDPIKYQDLGFDDNQISVIKAPPGPLLVTAGPGSGKTAVLTQRIVYLKKDCNISYDKILGYLLF